ncbi:ArsR/SmtB family transcription factor [Corynebacterium hindlerae]|uniref:ArsR/SmtB family transcription factor n=1 Tax=Corynebacterium hindlerae TaxID=699041 RepID=UPI001FCB8C53|nr:metalloregulator ArsR/SmtB family transcription factor [Corynebacterium hindlerae]
MTSMAATTSPLDVTGTTGPLRPVSDNPDFDHIVGVFKALADPTRLRLLHLVAQKGCEDVCGLELAEALGVSAPTVTHHMKKLIGMNLVKREQRGKWAYYSVNERLFTCIETLASDIIK